MKKKFAFTLAEVLITLTILGVVAAITVPSLQKMNYKRAQISRMAKAYATLQDAVTNIAANTNCIGKDITCTGLTKISNQEEMYNKFIELSKMRVTKSYNNGNWLRAFYLYCEQKPKECDGTSGDAYSYFRTTPDNIAYSLSKTNINITPEKGNGGLYSPGFLVTVFTDSDKQGTRKNIQGRNAFKFVVYGNFEVEPAVRGQFGSITALSIAMKAKSGWITKNYIYSFCDSSDTGTIDIGSGSNCAARIILDGWKMKY